MWGPDCLGQNYELEPFRCRVESTPYLGVLRSAVRAILHGLGLVEETAYVTIHLRFQRHGDKLFNRPKVYSRVTCVLINDYHVATSRRTHRCHGMIHRSGQYRRCGAPFRYGRRSRRGQLALLLNEPFGRTERASDSMRMDLTQSKAASPHSVRTLDNWYAVLLIVICVQRNDHPRALLYIERNLSRITGRRRGRRIGPLLV